MESIINRLTQHLEGHMPERGTGKEGITVEDESHNPRITAGIHLLLDGREFSL